jgi:hypothetical protein
MIGRPAALRQSAFAGHELSEPDRAAAFDAG